MVEIKKTSPFIFHITLPSHLKHSAFLWYERNRGEREREEKLEICLIWQEEKLRREKNKWWAEYFFCFSSKVRRKREEDKKVYYVIDFLINHIL